MSFEDLYKETMEYLESKCPEMATDIRMEVATWLTQRAMIKCSEGVNEYFKRAYKSNRKVGRYEKRDE